MFTHTCDECGNSATHSFQPTRERMPRWNEDPTYCYYEPVGPVLFYCEDHKPQGSVCKSQSPNPAP